MGRAKKLKKLRKELREFSQVDSENLIELPNGQKIHAPMTKRQLYQKGKKYAKFIS